MGARVTDWRSDEQSLKREVGWFGSFCMGYADVGADIYVALGLVAAYAAGASPLAFLIASISYICTGLAYAELTSTYPYAGGAQVYAMKSFNDLVGFIAGWAVMLDYTIDISLFSLATAGYLSFFFPQLKTGYLTFNLLGHTFNVRLLSLCAISLVLFLIAINLIGIKESAFLNSILVGLDLFVEGFILISGFILAFSAGTLLKQIIIVGNTRMLPQVPYPLKLDFKLQNFIYGVTIAMCSFIGIESIAQAAEETRRPTKWIPRAFKLSIVAVMIFAVGLSTLSMGMLPWEVLARSQEDPMAVIASHIPVVGRYLAPLVALTGFAICLVSTNTGVIGVSRIVFSMGRFRLLPRWFYKVHPRFRTPYRTIVIFSLIGALITLVGELSYVAELYNFGALLSYVIVNMCLVALRIKDPEAYRSWKTPGNIRIAGKEIPVIGLLGTAFCGLLWFLVILYHPIGRILGFAWVATGVVLFCLYRRAIGISPLSSEMGKTIPASGYVLNALVLVRTPEDVEGVVSSVKKSLDKRFNVTLMTIIDPRDYGLSLKKIEDYKKVKEIKEACVAELEEMAEKLRKEGYKCRVKVEIGSVDEVVEKEAKSHLNDFIVLIRRKSLKKEVEKRGEDALVTLASKYPGKFMVIRRV